MNDLILSDPYLPYPWWLTGLQLVVYPSQQAPHQNRQPLIKLIAFGLLWLLPVVPLFVLLGFAIRIGRNKSLLTLWGLMPYQRSSAGCSLSWQLLLDL
jgi:hypothetical protein